MHFLIRIQTQWWATIPFISSSEGPNSQRIYTLKEGYVWKEPNMPLNTPDRQSIRHSLLITRTSCTDIRSFGSKETITTNEVIFRYAIIFLWIWNWSGRNPWSLYRLFPCTDLCSRLHLHLESLSWMHICWTDPTVRKSAWVRVVSKVSPNCRILWRYLSCKDSHSTCSNGPLQIL